MARPTGGQAFGKMRGTFVHELRQQAMWCDMIMCWRVSLWMQQSIRPWNSTVRWRNAIGVVDDQPASMRRIRPRVPRKAD
ncbi:hypothetical protein [Burkholderia sp. USMB20]|uniref:hypothetical protein n=1 Tax=Burkholderia sp. USMB20 TaxID=1571773 RepID=UPI0005CE9AC8|nr:hypothetical protein [Burkholderia sp. USMB20]TGN94714.1 hypothetical protein PL79_028415 [Burkholderia sp. USMB20]